MKSGFLWILELSAGFLECDWAFGGTLFLSFWILEFFYSWRHPPSFYRQWVSQHGCYWFLSGFHVRIYLMNYLSYFESFNAFSETIHDVLFEVKKYQIETVTIELPLEKIELKIPCRWMNVLTLTLDRLSSQRC